MLDHPTEWEKAESSGADAYTHMVTTLTTAGMFTPPVPAHLVASLNGVDWAWGTTTALEPFAVYFDAFAVLGECLDPAFGDFWLYGHRGHGVNSYGLGMLTRVGTLLVAQQHAHGGGYMLEDTVTPINQANQSWSHLLRGIRRSKGPATRAVLFSDYRGYASIISNDPDHSEYVIDADHEHLPEGWSYLYSYDGFNDERASHGLDNLRESGIWHLELAAHHLWRLLHPGEDNSPYRRARAR
ncbi:MAG: hypothetical protein KDB40_20820 [Acidimicrobiales bacterium]|nr:hypothetical protein [Acidimicrobiales bacterium]